ncbi:MAG: hypothetical protein CMJ59_23800 [Planctomycetaceae bacterium]|nr:hypothetical protein [Planctomycetaceae bacterium]
MWGPSEEGGGPSEEESLAALGIHAIRIERNELGEVVEMQLHLYSSNEQLVYVKGLAKLETLDLQNCRQITDAGLLHLKGLANLTSLVLAGTRVTDTGMVHLKGLANLETLLLDNTNITDAGLVHLKGLTKLGYLKPFRHPSH